MTCLNKIQHISFLLDRFQEKSKHAAILSHLAMCADCRKKSKALNRQLGAMVKENNKECDLILNSLGEYIDGKLTIVDNINIKNHLEECYYCNYIYQNIKKSYSFEQVNAFAIPVPHGLVNTIDVIVKISSVFKIYKKLKIKQIIAGLKSYAEGFLAPLTPAPAPAFLGATIGSAIEFELSNPEIPVVVGESGRVVKILSMEDKELDRQTSDENGIALFKDFYPGRYKIAVEGFEVAKIEKITVREVK